MLNILETMRILLINIILMYITIHHEMNATFVKRDFGKEKENLK